MPLSSFGSPGILYWLLSVVNGMGSLRAGFSGILLPLLSSIWVSGGCPFWPALCSSAGLSFAILFVGSCCSLSAGFLGDFPASALILLNTPGCLSEMKRAVAAILNSP